jgi:hypothetical protein
MPIEGRKQAKETANKKPAARAHFDSAFGPETDISDGLMRLDSPLPRSVFPTAYFLPLLGQAVMAAAAMLLNSAGVAPSRAWIAIPWKTLR